MLNEFEAAGAWDSEIGGDGVCMIRVILIINSRLIVRFIRGDNIDGWFFLLRSDPGRSEAVWAYCGVFNLKKVRTNLPQAEHSIDF